MERFPEAGYVYAVCGTRKYVDEVLTSVRSLKKHDPEAHVTLIVDADTPVADDELSAFDHVVVVPGRFTEEDTWKDKLLFLVRHVYASSPYAKTFYLDSDTYLLGNCRGLFPLLDHFDLSLAHATNDRHKVTVSGVEIEAYTPYNTGVILFRKNEAVRDLFARWLSCYEARLTELPHDQPAFMEALALSPCTTYVFHNNWNARLIFPEKYRGKVMILHTRDHDLDTVAARINVRNRTRLWLSGIDQCLYKGMHGSDLLRIVLGYVKKRNS